MSEVTGTLTSLPQQMGKLGLGMTAAFTAPLVGIGAAALKAGMDVDSAVDTIRTTTGATGKLLDSLATSFKGVFSNVPVSAGAASTAIADLNVRLGLAGPPLEKLTTQMLNLARVSDKEVGPLVANVTRVFADWSISTERQSSMLDYLYRTTQSTGIGIDKLTGLVVQFGAPLRALGFDIEQGAALLGKWEKEGVNMETVLTGLRFALSKFAKAGEEPKAALDAVVQSIKGAKTESEATAIAFENFGKRAAVDMGRAIIEGRFNIDELVKSLKNSTDTINKAAADTDDFGERWTKFRNKLTLALEPMGGKLMDVLDKMLVKFEPLLGMVTSMIDAFGNLPVPIQATIIGITGTLAVAGPLLTAFSGLTLGIKGLAAGLSIATPLLGAGGLAGAAALATPALIAVGAAIAGWALYKGITALGDLEKKLDSTYEAASKGTTALAKFAGPEVWAGFSVSVLKSAESLDTATGAAARNTDGATKRTAAIRLMTVAELLTAEAITRGSSAISKSIGTMVDFLTAGDAAGKKLAYIRSESDQLAVAYYGLTLQGEALAETLRSHVKIADVNWTKSIKGGILETSAIMSGIGLKSTVDLRTEANRLGKEYERIIQLNKENKASALDVAAAYEKWSDAERKAAGISTTVNQDRKKGLQEISTIINDLGRSVSRGLMDLFTGKLNAGARKETEGLRKTLEASSADWTKYQEGASSSIQKLQDDLDKKLADLSETAQRGIAVEDKDFAKDIEKGVQRLGEIKSDLDEKLKDLNDSVQQRIADQNKDFARDIEKGVEKLQDIKADLSEALEDLNRTARRRIEDENKDFGRDSERGTRDITRVQGDLDETLRDSSFASNRKIEDENRDFARDTDKLNAALVDAERKRDKVRVAEIKKDLATRATDHATAVKRIREDLAELHRDAKQKAAEQTADIKAELDRRTADHAASLKRIQEDLNESTGDAKRKAAEQTFDINKELATRETDHSAALQRIQEDLEKSSGEATSLATEQTADIKAELATRTADHDAALLKIKEGLEQSNTDAKALAAKQTADIKAELDLKAADFATHTAALVTKLDEAGGTMKAIFTSLGTFATGVLDSIGEGITRSIINKVIESTGIVKKLEDALEKVLGKIPGLGGIFGGATETAKDTAGSAAGAVASATGAAASSGAMGAVAGVSSAVSAVSDVISNFQFYAMNKSLDIIVKHTLQAANDLANLRADHWLRETHMMEKLDDLHTRMVTLLGVWRSALTFQLGDWRLYLEGQMDRVIQNTALVPVGAPATANAGGTVVQITGGTYMSDRAIDELLDLLVNRLKQRNA